MEAGGFELLAASLRADARDLDAFVEALATKLSAAFPDRTEVEREGFRGRGRVRAVTVELGEHRYGLERGSGDVTCTRARAVRGIVLKNDELVLDEWIDSLSRDLARGGRAERARTGGARPAVARMSEPPFVSTLSAGGFVTLATAGFRPLRQVQGTSIVSLGLQRRPSQPVCEAW